MREQPDRRSITDGICRGSNLALQSVCAAEPSSTSRTDPVCSSRELGKTSLHEYMFIFIAVYVRHGRDRSGPQGLFVGGWWVVMIPRVLHVEHDDESRAW